MPFDAIIGHAPIVELLRHAVARGRTPQSLLFAGPEGVGKFAVAMALAQAVNCPRRLNGDACGTCPTCDRILRRRHSDVTVIDRGDEPSIKIKAVRERLLESVNYRPFEAERRVYIIDPADALTNEAQDALLKTLEEPPPAAIIVLITAYPDTLLPTIRSRTRRLRFGWLLEQDVARFLTERAGVAPAAAAKLAAASGGSVSRALAEEGGQFEDDRDAALGLLAAAPGRSLTARLKAASALAQHGTDRRDREALSERLSALFSLLRDLAALQVGSVVPLANADLAKALQGLVPAYDIDRVTAACEAIEQADEALSRNASPKIVADWLAVTI